MRTFALICVLTFSNVPGLVSADDACDDLWFVRNLIFATNGYCFGSPLGKVVFGTDNCSTKTPTLSAVDKSKVAQAKAMEQRWQCRVDTNKTQLDLHSPANRKALLVQPLHDDTESGCIGYQGPAAPLYAAHSSSSQIIGYVRKGNDFGNAHVSFDDDINSNWMFVSFVSNGDTLLPDIGWTDKNLWTHCAQIAG